MFSSIQTSQAVSFIWIYLKYKNSNINKLCFKKLVKTKFTEIIEMKVVELN